MLKIDDMAAFCKKKGFVYRSSDIYGGYSGFFDFGPLGVEMFNALKNNWWKYFVQDRMNMVGIDASIISHPDTWKASGHLDSFGDLLLVCAKCKTKLRADHFIEEELDTVADGLDIPAINTLIKKHNLVCPSCKGKFKEMKDFNLLFPTKVGASDDTNTEAYLRGETAQGIFMDYKQIVETSRMKLPFGIAQVGRCFRNEISARDFLFRCREFHIGELEFFIHPDEKKCSLLTKEHLNLKLNVLTAKTQDKNKKDLTEMTIKDMIKKKMIGEWHAYWLVEQYFWFMSIGLSGKNLKVREHINTELSHYSSATLDFDYSFPFGSKEISGNANRGQYDLEQHAKFSKQKMELFDEASKKKVIPRVIEPTFGMERVFLALLFDSYEDDKKRGNVVLKLNKDLAPIKVAVLPLVNKVNDKAMKVYDSLRKDFVSFYDKSGSVGRRYARADEQGVPYCVTVDFDEGVTVRDRDSTKQIRVKEDELLDVLDKLMKGRIKFEKAGKLV
ncbi:MAG: glycine--tRNA ligase [Nanoarchaeota archaeon]|nr:glycine--tRNA ligase [Nanoarchaeota archaeon]